ncbi:MAG TPA: hypothetical protein VL137_13125, partial [Polyangiaceae bacterium]|nr:hypothetical protein [Polyangiaceae bacterium]
MTQPNVQLIQSVYAAFGRGDVAFITAQLAADSRWDFNVRHSDVPWHVPVAGAGEISRFFGALAENVTF